MMAKKRKIEKKKSLWNGSICQVTPTRSGVDNNGFYLYPAVLFRKRHLLKISLTTPKIILFYYNINN